MAFYATAEPGPTELRDLADDLMQLVAVARRAAFEVVYERHSSAAFCSPIACAAAARSRGRRPGGVPARSGAARALLPRPWLGPHVGAGSSTTGRSTPAALRGPRPPPRQRRGHRGALRGARPHRRRGRAARRGAGDPPGAHDAARRAVPRDRARVLGGSTQSEIASMLEPRSARSRPHAPRPGEDARQLGGLPRSCHERSLRCPGSTTPPATSCARCPTPKPSPRHHATQCEECAAKVEELGSSRTRS